MGHQRVARWCEPESRRTVFCLGGLASPPARWRHQNPVHRPPHGLAKLTSALLVQLGAPKNRGACGGLLLRIPRKSSWAKLSLMLMVGFTRPGGCDDTSNHVSPLPHRRWLSGRVCVAHPVATQVTDGQSSAGGHSLLVGR